MNLPVEYIKNKLEDLLNEEKIENFSFIIDYKDNFYIYINNKISNLHISINNNNIIFNDYNFNISKQFNNIDKFLIYIKKYLYNYYGRYLDLVKKGLKINLKKIIVLNKYRYSLFILKIININTDYVSDNQIFVPYINEYTFNKIEHLINANKFDLI